MMLRPLHLCCRLACLGLLWVAPLWAQAQVPDLDQLSQEQLEALAAELRSSREPEALPEEPVTPRDELFLAIELKDVLAARAALASGADSEINLGDPSPLGTAALHNDLRMVVLLLDSGGDPSATEDSPLEEAVRNESTRMVELLMRAGAQVPTEAAGQKLFRLAQRGEAAADLSGILLDHGASPDLCLAAATDQARAELMRYCLNRGASAGALPAEMNPLGVAIASGEEQLVEMILEGEATDRLLVSGFTEAVAAGRTDLVQRALAAGAEPTFRQVEAAIENGHPDLGLLLLEQSPPDDPFMLRGGNVAALVQRAEDLGFAEVAAALRTKGGISPWDLDTWLPIALGGLLVVVLGALLWGGLSGPRTSRVRRQPATRSPTPVEPDRPAPDRSGPDPQRGPSPDSRMDQGPVPGSTAPSSEPVPAAPASPAARRPAAVAPAADLNPAATLPIGSLPVVPPVLPASEAPPAVAAPAAAPASVAAPVAPPAMEAPPAPAPAAAPAAQPYPLVSEAPAVAAPTALGPAASEPAAPPAVAPPSPGAAPPVVAPMAPPGPAPSPSPAAGSSQSSVWQVAPEPVVAQSATTPERVVAAVAQPGIELRMPEVDLSRDAEAVFDAARQAGARDVVRPDAPDRRQVVLVTPARVTMMRSCPAPGTLTAEQLALAEQLAGGSPGRNVAAIAYTDLEAIGDRMDAAIPFFGLLGQLGYLGHTVWIFEGHVSAMSAGCRDADLLIVDDGMMPYLPGNWRSVATRVMRGADIHVFERKTGALRRLS